MLTLFLFCSKSWPNRTLCCPGGRAFTNDCATEYLTRAKIPNSSIATLPAIFCVLSGVADNFPALFNRFRASHEGKLIPAVTLRGNRYSGMERNSMGETKEEPPLLQGCRPMMISMNNMGEYGLKTGPGIKDTVKCKWFDKIWILGEWLSLRQTNAWPFI